MASAYPNDDRIRSLLRSVSLGGLELFDVIYYIGYSEGYRGKNIARNFPEERQLIYDMGYADGKGDGEIDDGQA